MSFAIMRFAKLKTGSPISGSVSHIARSRPTPNADPERRHLNRSIIGPEHDDAAAIRSAIADRTPDKFRKDAVRVLEFIVTATPGWFEQNPSQTDAYFDSAVDWLKQQFGAENVVCAVQHNDESTPHAHVMVVPIDPDSSKLNAKRWVGGRGKMRQLQTDFANHQADFGVKRGKPNPDRQHTTLAAWRDGHSKLDERESHLEQERQKIAAERQAAVDIREEANNLRSKALMDEERAAEETRRAAGILKAAEARLAQAKELEARLEPLQADLSAREKENEAHHNRIVGAVKELEAWKAHRKGWETKRNAWLAKHRPAPLSAVQKLSLDLASMPDKQRIDQMRLLFEKDRPMADAVDRLNWVTYDDGSVTQEGRKALVEHGSLKEHTQRETAWKESGLDSGPSGP